MRPDVVALQYAGPDTASVRFLTGRSGVVGSTTSWSDRPTRPLLDVADCRLVLDRPAEGVRASDHLGVLAELRRPPPMPGVWEDHSAWPPGLRSDGMTRFVIDAPTLLHLVAEGVAVAPGHQLVAPQLLRSQALDLLYDAVRRGDLSEEAALDRHEAMTGVKVRLLGDRVSRTVAWRIAREHDLPSTADAEYLALTRLQADAFVTVDPSARTRAEGIVAVGTVDQLSRPADG